MKIGKTTIEYVQKSDSNEIDGRSMQTLEVTAEPSLLHLYENGKADYFITIKTERFAFDDESELIAIFKDFKKRIKDNEKL